MQHHRVQVVMMHAVMGLLLHYPLPVMAGHETGIASVNINNIDPASCSRSIWPWSVPKKPKNEISMGEYYEK
jgi:hypothetical protein